MPITIDEIYNQVVRVLPSSGRLKLVNLILSGLVQQDGAIDDSDIWTDEDITDLSTFSFTANIIEEIEDYCLGCAMDEAAKTSVLDREAALKFLEGEFEG